MLPYIAKNKPRKNDALWNNQNSFPIPKKALYQTLTWQSKNKFLNNAYNVTCYLLSRYKVFQQEIPDRMSYTRTLYDHFENFRKIKFQWERIFEKKPWPCANFRPIFNLKKVLISQKISESKLGVPYSALKKCPHSLPYIHLVLY